MHAAPRLLGGARHRRDAGFSYPGEGTTLPCLRRQGHRAEPFPVTAELPPEAVAELKRIRHRIRARDLVAEALLAVLAYQLLYPLPEQPDEVNLDRYLSGR
jgi:hypothetical protein